MKKLLLAFTMLFMFAGFVYSQTPLYEDNLDTYAANSYLGQVNPDWWTTWSTTYNFNLDIQVKTNLFHSAPNSGVADKVGGQCDAILKLGNKVSGAYELKWWMYVETAKCGYYNIQHMESPGTEWAFEVYFRTSGAIILQHSGLTINGTYPKATWFEVKQTIDLDADSIKLYINNVLLDKWLFSDQASDPGGTKQLGGVDFFAGEYTGTTESPVFYIDDIAFIETTSGNDPVITVLPDSVAMAIVGGNDSTNDLTVSNTGLSDLVFDVNIVYDVPGKKSSSVNGQTNNNVTVKRSLSNANADPTPTPGGPGPVSDATGQLHYDGDNISAIGWLSPPITVTVAARFPNAMTLPYAGLDLTSVEVFVNDLNAPPASNLMKIQIFDMGNTYEAGPLLYEQEFTPVGAAWETITLTTPVKITGADLWVGYNLTQTDADIFIPGTDGGPADVNGDFMSTGIGWSHVTTDANWNIRANLSGDLIVQWLGVAPMNGTVIPAANTPLALSFNTVGLALGQYTATIKLLSNDPETPILDVPVTLDVVGVGMSDVKKIGVMIYPNPVIDKLNVVSDGAISNISIKDVNGKTIYNGNSQSIDISNLSTGVYFVQVVTAQGISNTKFIKK